jgi:2-methylcitrate dehydratase PrpD
LEGEHSYLSAFAERADAGALTDGLGQQFEIMRGSIKKWCVGSPIQAALDAVTALIADHGVGADDVAALRAIMPDDRLPIVDGRDMPDICLQHLLAIALIDGGVTFASCHDHARMHDPKVLELRARMTAVPSRELTHAVPARQAIVEIDCTDGRRLRHHARAVQGTPENPMSAAEVEAKARDLVGPILGSARAEQFLTALRDVGQATDLRALVAAMRPAE